MFDLDGESLWMGPNVSRRSPRRKPIIAVRKTFKRTKSFRNAQRSFSNNSQGSFFEVVSKGYSGSAKQEYLKREKAFKKAREEKEYSQKLKKEYGVKSPLEKVKDLFKGKPKSIYK